MQDYQASLDWIDRQSTQMRALLEQWALINSGSYNPLGLAKMAEALKAEFSQLEAQVDELALAPTQIISPTGETTETLTGPALHLRKREEAPLQIIFTGHMDTVYPEDHPFQQNRYLDENTLNGPGVADMKGGLVIMLYALLAFEQHPLAKNIGWTIFLNPDEEIGSHSSAKYLKQYASEHQLGLIFEPAMTPTGTLASKRKGSGQFTLVVHGVSAHAGRSFDLGRNAIVAMGQAIEAIHQLNGQREDVTINIGIIQGGSAINAVPDVCICQIDVRTKQHSDQAWIDEHFANIIQSIRTLDGIRVELHGGFGRQPKVLDAKMQHLLDLFAETGRMLGLTIDWQPSGGCCDGNNLAAAGLPVIDSLGARGGHIHSPKEYILLDSLAERAQLTCLFLLRLASGEIKLKDD